MIRPDFLIFTFNFEVGYREFIQLQCLPPMFYVNLIGMYTYIYISGVCILDYNTDDLYYTPQIEPPGIYDKDFLYCMRMHIIIIILCKLSISQLVLESQAVAS